MSDKLENCPVCKNKLNEHRVQDFIDCIQKLFEKNEGKRHNLMNPTKIILTGNAKNQEALSVITDLIKNNGYATQYSQNDKLAIKYLLIQKELLEKLREILL